MSQNVVNYGIDPSGAQLLDELLSGEQQNRLTMDGGNSRPSYAEIGTVWTDKSVEGKATLKRFNGTSDNALMTIDETTGAITIPGIADTDLSNLSTTGKHYVAFKGYDAAETYALNDIVVNVDVDNNVKLYQSLADNNTSPLTDGTKWKEVSLGGGGGADIGDMGFAPLGIDESLNLRRYLNGQVISQTQFVSFTNKVKSAVVLFPSLATDEATWQAEKAMSKFGQVGKFVIDDTAGTIRLPAVVNPQGLLSLSGIGNLVNESLPNITGQHAGVYNSIGQSGALYGTYGGENLKGASTNTSTLATLYIDASRSSSTYQDGAPVQQEAVQYPYFIQVATGIEETLPAIREYKVNNSDYFGKSMYSAITPDNASWLASNGQYNARTVYPDYYDWLNGKIGQVITANGGKVVLSTDTYTDYDFVVNQNDQTFRLPLLNGEEDLPGDTYENLTLQASGSNYTAPANGWYTICKHGTAGQLAAFENYTAGTITWITTLASETDARTSVPVKKGDVVKLWWNASGTTNHFRFVYATGNGSLYYYVGDTVQDASLINAAAVLNTLSGKVSYDDLTTVHCVVETFKSGSSWYRVYDDGWVEQGGYWSGSAVASGGLGYQTVNLLKTMRDGSYFISWGKGEGTRLFDVGYSSLNTTSFTLALANRYSTTLTPGLKWEVKGYGA